MLALAVAGLLSYAAARARRGSVLHDQGRQCARRNGRAPTATEMRDQVADLIEKKLQELPYLEKIETYTKPGYPGDAA